MSNHNIPLTPQPPPRNPYQHLLSSAHHQSFSQPSDEPPSISPNDILTITNNQIHQLVHRHQKFVTVICMLIDTAEKQIVSDSIANALQVLKITEKILEYAASCGKNLQKKLIFHVLHNLACSYQKFWDLEHCSNYLQALIYNANEKFGVTSSITESTISKQKSSSKSESIMNTFPESQICPSLQQIKRSIITPKLNIGEQIRNIKYNLQIAAINSQLKNHLKSAQYGENGIRLLHELFATLNNHITNRDKQISHLNINSKIRSEIFPHSFKIITSVNNSSHVITTENFAKYQEICQHLLKSWTGFQTRNCQLFEELSNCKEIKQFTIGYVMQLKTYIQELNETQMTETKNREYELYSMVPDLISICNNQKIVKYVLLLCIAHFTKATELRLHSRLNKNMYESQNIRSSNNQESLLLAECYHLYAMILYFIYIPVKLDLINHIVSSYLRQYNDAINLDELFNRSNQLKKQGQILIDRLMMNKKKGQSKQKIGNGELSSDAVKILKEIDPQSIHKQLKLQYSSGQDRFSIGKSQQLYTNQSQIQNLNGYDREKLIKENEQAQQLCEQKAKMKSIQKRYKGVINKKFNFEEQVLQIPKTPRNKSFTRLRKRQSSNLHKSALNLHKGKLKKSGSKLKVKKNEMNNFRKADKVKIRNMLDEVFKDTEDPINPTQSKKPKAINDNKTNKKNCHSSSFIEGPPKKKNQKSEKKKLQKNSSQKSISNNSSKNDGGYIKGIKSKGKVNNLKSPKKNPRNSYHQYFC